MVVDHAHPQDPQAVDTGRAGTLSASSAAKLSELLKLLSDPTRVRIVFALAAAQRMCVGDLALALDLSMDQSSYALKQLRAAGLVQVEREGRVMHYSLAAGFPRQLVDHCLLELIEISEERTR